MDFDRAECGGFLLDVADEAWQEVLDGMSGGWEGSRGGDFAAFGIQGGGGGSEFDGSQVLFWLGHKLFGEFGGAAEEDDEDAGGEGVEGTGMADLDSAGQAPLDFGDDGGG